MRAKGWSILGMVLAILILGGYAVVAATAPGAQSAGTEIGKSGQTVVLPGEITSEVTSSRTPGSDLSCPSHCTKNADCQIPTCCDPYGGACGGNGRCLCP